MLMFWCCLNRSDSFENPVLQQHFRNLEALALDMMESEQVVDLTRKKCGLSWEGLLLFVGAGDWISGAHTLWGGSRPPCLVSYSLSWELFFKFKFEGWACLNSKWCWCVCVCARGTPKENCFCFWLWAIHLKCFSSRLQTSYLDCPWERFSRSP